ncbi:hypothetical protein NEOKW01_0536 [Nematocida sp. AWRm80]|nr:hypothetical protein NEOKW01_0536 [Nematocida sp. AWRm80]
MRVYTGLIVLLNRLVLYYCTNGKLDNIIDSNSIIDKVVEDRRVNNEIDIEEVPRADNLDEDKIEIVQMNQNTNNDVIFRPRNNILNRVNIIRQPDTRRHTLEIGQLSRILNQIQPPDEELVNSLSPLRGRIGPIGRLSNASSVFSIDDLGEVFSRLENEAKVGSVIVNINPATADNRRHSDESRTGFTLLGNRMLGKLACIELKKANIISLSILFGIFLAGIVIIYIIDPKLANKILLFVFESNRTDTRDISMNNE